MTNFDSSSNDIVVVLDHTLAASKARVSPEVKHILIDILKEAIIIVYHEYFYRVDFGPDVYPQVHIVSHDLFCSCVLVADCPSVTAVKVYLQRRMGEPARKPDPRILSSSTALLSSLWVKTLLRSRAFVSP